LKYLLDTCVLSELPKKKPNKGVLDWISSQSNFDLAVSVLTLGELVKGTHYLPDSPKRTTLQIWIIEQIAESFEGRVLPVSDEIAARWGSIAGQAEKKGKPLPVIDSLLLATASIHELAIVTRNVADFRHFDVEVINPWTL
jgi:predicted nucleic acid-binding protein